MKIDFANAGAAPRLRPAPAPFSNPDHAMTASPTLPRDWTSTWLVLLTSVAMAFLASLALATSSGVGAVADGWTSELARKATVSLQLDGEDAARDAARLSHTLTLIAETPGVAEAHALAVEDVSDLLAPWLGIDAETDPDLIQALPLPTLIDLELADGVSPGDVAARLRHSFEEARVPAEIDAHEQWVDRLKPPADRVRGLAQAGLALIAIAAALMVALSCATALAAQARMVEVLRLVGGSDAFVAGIFVRRFQVLAFIGSAIGAGGAATALLLASGGEAEPQGEIAPLLPDMTPDPWIWAQLATLPLFFALIATGAAWAASMIVLRRTEG